MSRIIIDELITLVSIKLSKDSKKALESFDNGLKSISRVALAATGSLTAMGYAMDKLLSGVDKQARFADGLGVGYENLQRLQYAAAKARIGTDELDSALNTLVQTMTSTKPGEYNGALLQLGLSARNLDGSLKDPIQLLLEIGDALKRLSAIRRQQFGGSRFGFGSQFTNFLGQGSEQIRKDMEEAERIGAVLPERVSGVASDYYDNFLKLKITIKGLATAISVALAPALTKILDQFDQWVIKNKELLGQHIGTFIEGLSKGFMDFANIVIYLVKALDDLLKAIFGTTSNLTEVNAIAATTTLVLGGLATALVLASLDFIVLGAAVTGVVAIFKNFDSITKSINDEIGKLVDKLKVIEKVKDIFNTINPANIDIGGYLGTLKSYFDASSANKLASTLANIDSYKDNVGALTSDIGKRSSLAGAPGSGSSVNNNVTINVNGASEPQVVANIVKQKIDLATSVQVANPGFNRPAVT